MKAYMYTVLSKVFDLESVHLEGVPKTFFFCCNVAACTHSGFLKCLLICDVVKRVLQVIHVLKCVFWSCPPKYVVDLVEALLVFTKARSATKKDQHLGAKPQ